MNSNIIYTKYTNDYEVIIWLQINQEKYLKIEEKKKEEKMILKLIKIEEKKREGNQNKVYN